MADLVFNFDISGMEGVRLYICWNFYEFFVWALYMEPSPVFKVYVYMNWR